MSAMMSPLVFFIPLADAGLPGQTGLPLKRLGWMGGFWVMDDFY
jgi:hypothetical protein